MLVMVSTVFDVLVRVTDWEPLLAPTVTEPKERLVADNETVGKARPVPVS